MQYLSPVLALGASLSSALLARQFVFRTLGLVSRGRALKVLVPMIAVALAACAGPEPSSKATLPPSQTQNGPPRTKIGLLLPLSGNATGIGHALDNAAELALFDAGASDVELLPRDTGTSVSTASGAAQTALVDGAQVMVGPLGSRAVRAVSAIVRPRGIDLFGFSTDRNVAGGGTYLLGFMPEEQVRTIVRFASNAGIKRFAAYLPRDAYGALARTAFTNAVTKAGGTLVGIETYLPGHPEVTPALHNLVAPGPNGHPPVEGLLIPEGGATLHQILSVLAGAGYVQGSIRLLGTDQWTQADIRHEPMAVDGWYAGPEPGRFERFARHYRDTYGLRPPRIAAQAYDAVTLATTLAHQPGGIADSRALLTSPDGFTGVDGLFRFKSDGTPEHGLAIIEVSPDGLRVVRPAPTSFGVPAS